ncbi:hypothetical protein BKA64DRAFT_714098 [Cadophora sp. MPI-SDFR-AT-0126]|nr:hypothetical protein BKA64DRAFT_714098 [Leotiomycetes sp. MPI-SDFR-AT-0126]
MVKEAGSRPLFAKSPPSLESTGKGVITLIPVSQNRLVALIITWGLPFTATLAFLYLLGGFGKPGVRGRNVSLSSNHDLDEILEPSLHSTGSVSYGSSPPLDDQSSHSEAEPDLPMCKRCDCEQCKKRAKRKRGKTASIETVGNLFPRPDLINILDKYWEVLQAHGLFADQSREPFQWSDATNGPVHVQRRQSIEARMQDPQP